MAASKTEGAIPTLGNKTPYQQGSADSYYRRVGKRKPHKQVGFKKVYDLTLHERIAYFCGVRANEKAGDFKEFGEWS